MDGCVCLHPSLHAEDMAGRNHSDLLKAQNCPVLVGAAGNDQDWTKPGAEWEQSSTALGFGEKSKFYVFPEMLHGWTTRGDVKDEKIARDVNIAMDQVLEFLSSLE
jgi:dienelactone hydrolase